MNLGLQQGAKTHADWNQCNEYFPRYLTQCPRLLLGRHIHNPILLKHSSDTLEGDWIEY